MKPAPRRLVLMRHAQAERFAADDHARRLTDRGRLDARAAGAWLAEHRLVPDHAYVSSAARAVSTWESVEEGLHSGAEVSLEDSLHAGGPESVLQVLRTAPDESTCVLLVGHNPSVSFVAQMLDDGSPDPEAFREMSEGYPPAALTVLDVAVPWVDLAEGGAHISDFHVGRG